MKFKSNDSHPIGIDRKSEYRSTCHWKSCQSHKVTFSNIMINMRKNMLHRENVKPQTQFGKNVNAI